MTDTSTALDIVESLLSGEVRNRPKGERLLLALQERERFARTTMANIERLKERLDQHPRRDAVIERIATECARATRTSAQALLGDLDKVLSTYIELYSKSHIELSYAFSELPQPLTLCELKAVRTWHMEVARKGKHASDEIDQTLTLVKEHTLRRVEYLQFRYTLIFGAPFSASDALLERLLSRKAPVPLRPAWKTARHASDGIETPVGSPPVRSVAEPGLSTQPDNGDDLEPTAEEERSTSCGECAVGAVYDLAGGVRPQQPDVTTPRHTFPGALSIGEDIYYDYAVLVPINDCATCGEQNFYQDESVLAARLIAGKIGELVGVFDEWNVTTALGSIGDTAVLHEVSTYVNAVSVDLQSATVTERRRFQRALRQYSSAIRLTARTELMTRSPEAGVLERMANELAERVANVRFSTPARILPQKAKEGEATRSSVLVPQGATLVDAEYENDFFGTATNAYIYPRERSQGGTQWEYLGPYMRSLGPFAERVDALKSSARSLAEAVLALQQGSSASADAFRELLSGWINEILLSLADLLDQMAETLPLAPKVREEGSMRVGLQLVYRQYWVPQGYVRGKLVGYKNLIPNQKDSVFRRTLVRTTTETSTAEQFDSLRQSDTSSTQRETADLLKEVAADFKLTQTTSGHFEMGVWGLNGETSINAGLRSTSQAKQSMFSEVVQKGSTRFNEKRETKIRQLSESEDVTEVRTELHNANAEITANYFYYQLLREYRVSVELHDIIPVLMRTRSVPTSGEIDDHFISRYIHILAPRFPAQIAQDAKENVEELDLLAKEIFRARATFDQRREEYEIYRSKDPPLSSDFERYNAWLDGMRSREAMLNEARAAADRTAAAYARARARMDRVVTHVRENRLYYMQFIWQSTSVLDEDELLMEEAYCGQSLPEITRGLMRRGYLGREEIFEYSGHSSDLFEAVLERLVPGSELASLPLERLEETTLFQYMRRYYPEDSVEELVARIQAHAFLEDMSATDEVLSERYVQIAQDALVVETMPGQVPLLEGFQLAHRMLDVQRACLENQHLRARIADRPWQQGGEDSYAVRRYDGPSGPSQIKEET